MAVKESSSSPQFYMSIIFTPTKEEAGSIGRECIVTGMGMLAMTHALYKNKDLMSGEIAILAGFCGLLKGDQAIGDKIIPSVFIDGDYNAYPLEQSIHFIEVKKNPTIACISQSRLLTYNPYKDICDNFKTVITDMESYAFVEFCTKFKISYKVIRVISDKVGESSANDYISACKTNQLGLAVEKYV